MSMGVFVGNIVYVEKMQGGVRLRHTFQPPIEVGAEDDVKIAWDGVKPPRVILLRRNAHRNAFLEFVRKVSEIPMRKITRDDF